jgi:Na+-translocating ferredoxin:NAD+ oxidoreductase subunit A
MKELVIIFISTALVNNVVLSRFLGLCPFLGVSKKTETAAGMGTAIIFVVTLSSILTAIIYKGILIPTNLEYMDTIVFIVVIAALVQFIEMFLKKYIPSLYKALGVYLPLITTNCCVLGTAITNVEENYNILESALDGLGTSVGFTISIIIMASIRERNENNPVPKTLQGSPIVLITAGLMSIAFCGFAGLL